MRHLLVTRRLVALDRHDDSPAVPGMDRVSAAWHALDVGFGSTMSDEWEDTPPG